MYTRIPEHDILQLLPPLYWSLFREEGLGAVDEELRARIKDGTFTASANELAGPLSKLLDEER